VNSSNNKLSSNNKNNQVDSINNIFNNYFNIYSDQNTNLSSLNFAEKDNLVLSKDFSSIKTNYLNSFRASSNNPKQNTDNTSTNHNLDNFSQYSKKERCNRSSCYKYHKKIVQEKDDFIKVLLNERSKLKQTVK
jgi:hypothetical protein